MNTPNQLFNAAYSLLLSGLILSLLISPLALAKDDYQTHSSITETARAHAEQVAGSFGKQVEIQVFPLDRRLKLAQCDQPLQSYDSPNGVRPGRSVVGVRCAGSKPWKLYVSVRVKVQQAVIVSRRALPQGHLVAAADVQLLERDSANLLRGYFSSADQVIGQRIKRHLGAGKVITPSSLARDQLVKRGADVEILASVGLIEVRMRGKAMSDGGLGERIRVRNDKSGRVISGTVIDNSVIQVQQ